MPRLPIFKKSFKNLLSSGGKNLGFVHLHLLGKSKSSRFSSSGSCVNPAIDAVLSSPVVITPLKGKLVVTPRLGNSVLEHLQQVPFEPLLEDLL